MQEFTEQPPRCDHPETSLRHRRTSSGSKTYGRQCLECGSCVEKVAASRLDASPVAAWDDSLAPAWQEHCRSFWRRRQEWFEAERTREQQAFWERYDAHLDSPKWSQIRSRVLRRANGICEGCGTARPSHVHHLTYVRLGDEMLFDLVAVCPACHEKIHGRPIGDDED